jgi:hypothetical protein
LLAISYGVDASSQPHLLSGGSVIAACLKNRSLVFLATATHERQRNSVQKIVRRAYMFT